MIRVLFVCMGNICRSPIAQGIFEKLIEDKGLQDKFEVDSAGLGDWHIGLPPDERAIKAAALRGYDISRQRCRQVNKDDYKNFDYILTMEKIQVFNLERARPNNTEFNRAKIQIINDYIPNAAFDEVPDPYFGGDEGFEMVIDMLEVGVENFLSFVLVKSC